MFLFCLFCFVEKNHTEWKIVTKTHFCNGIQLQLIFVVIQFISDWVKKKEKNGAKKTPAGEV